jgi:hypothetical protein
LRQVLQAATSGGASPRFDRPARPVFTGVSRAGRSVLSGPRSIY